MRTLAAPPRVSEVEAKGHDSLAVFSCGPENEGERELDAAVRKLARTGGPSGTQAYIAEDSSPKTRGGFIGVVSFFRWWPAAQFRDLDLPPLDDAVCIQALGITEAYRKSLVSGVEEDTPVGAWLLDWSLNEIRTTWADEMLPVWALVHKENERCRGMVAAQGFALYPVGGPYDIWVHPQDAD